MNTNTFILVAIKLFTCWGAHHKPYWSSWVSCRRLIFIIHHLLSILFEYENHTWSTRTADNFPKYLLTNRIPEELITLTKQIVVRTRIDLFQSKGDWTILSYSVQSRSQLTSLCQLRKAFWSRKLIVVDKTFLILPQDNDFFLCYKLVFSFVDNW